MERRLLVAIALMVGVMVLSNVLFPPTELPPGAGTAEEAVTTATDDAGLGEVQEPGGGVRAADEAAAAAAQAALELQSAQDAEAMPSTAGQIVTVASDLYEYRFDSRGARLISARMLEYESFAASSEGGVRVELVRPDDAILGYRVAAGADTVSLDPIVFSPSTTRLDVTDGPRELTFRAAIGDAGIPFDVTYRFYPDDYRIDASGGLRGLDRGHAVLIGLGRGIGLNEANQREDMPQMALVTRSRAGAIDSERLDRIDPGESRAVAGGPFAWAASKSKYWLVAIVSPTDGPGIGGVVLRGADDEASADMRVTLPVPAGTDGFEYQAYLGPQDFGRLQGVGQELHNVNPYGWRWLRWFIRPFGNLMLAVLIWMHQSFSMAYGWVLIMFGVASRIILFPLYQISMRQQMKQMGIQPEIKRIQERYKEDPPKLQQEMMKTYKEHGVSPLGGCLPMMLPMPILITLFFVFQNTIELRGVPFWWITDLSLKDPLYIIPVLMGGSMLGLNWIAQRGMETNQQMKMFTYAFPVIFTFMFAQFAAGLNMYYTASNIASLPQQLYLSKERRKAQVGTKKGDATKGDGTAAERSAKPKSGSKRTRKKGPGGPR